MGTGNQEKAGLSWRKGAVIKCSSLGYAGRVTAAFSSLSSLLPCCLGLPPEELFI